MTKRLLAVWFIFMASMGLAHGEETELPGRMFDYTDMPSVPMGVKEARVIGSGDHVVVINMTSMEVSRLDGDSIWKKIGKLDFEITHEPIVSHAGDLYCVGVKSNGVQDVLKLSVNADSVSSSVISSLPIELDGLKAAVARIQALNRFCPTTTGMPSSECAIINGSSPAFSAETRMSLPSLTMPPCLSSFPLYPRLMTAARYPSD